MEDAVPLRIRARCAHRPPRGIRVAQPRRELLQKVRRYGPVEPVLRLGIRDFPLRHERWPPSCTGRRGVGSGSCIGRGIDGDKRLGRVPLGPERPIAGAAAVFAGRRVRGRTRLTARLEGAQTSPYPIRRRTRSPPVSRARRRSPRSRSGTRRRTRTRTPVAGALATSFNHPFARSRSIGPATLSSGDRQRRRIERRRAAQLNVPPAASSTRTCARVAGVDDVALPEAARRNQLVPRRVAQHAHAAVDDRGDRRRPPPARKQEPLPATTSSRKRAYLHGRPRRRADAVSTTGDTRPRRWRASTRILRHRNRAERPVPPYRRRGSILRTWQSPRPGREHERTDARGAVRRR